MPPSLALAGDPPRYAGDMDEDLKLVARNRLADQITGGLAKPSKMPTVAWGISAFRCLTGELLAHKDGSVCASCYARMRRYLFPAVQAKAEQRRVGMYDRRWTPAMVFLITYHCDEYFRWFDSGDLQGPNHLSNIATIAEHTPHITHWLPTREIEIVRAVLKERVFPPNLTIRMSAHYIDGPAPDWPTTSGVYSAEPPEGAFDCPAQHQDNACGDCRACWSQEPHVVYPLK